jgi:hypothetical protein
LIEADMPTADIVLSWAAGVANEWRWLAFMWHVSLAALLLTVAVARVPQRLFGFLLILPIASVAVIAVLSWNPFNALTFIALTVVLGRCVTYLPATTTVASRRWFFAGASLVAFGWLYPHFLVTDSWLEYAYASPFGLLPCPTLAVVVGMTLAVGGLRSARWNGAVAGAGLFYGAIGVFTLAVRLDWWLLAGATLLSALVVANFFAGRVCATVEERTRRLAGDELIPAAMGTLTHAITIDGPPVAVWPWLVQMGAGSRAGWYSYDFLDNGGLPSATRIVPALQQITIGSVFPAAPGLTEGFVVLALEEQRSLILGWPNPDGPPMATWAFMLVLCAGGSTRLIVRVRGAQGYRFHGLPPWLSYPAVRLVHFVMQRKQLLEIAHRVELSKARLNPRAATA